MDRTRFTGHWKRVLALVLCCVLLVPQLYAPAHADGADHHATGHPQGANSTGHHHDAAAERDPDPHCHPGIDCHLQAIVAILTAQLPRFDLDQQVVLPKRHREAGIDHGFDPPPPRSQS